MKHIKKVLSASEPVIIPDDHSTDVTYVKKFIKATNDLLGEMNKYERHFDQDFMRTVDPADYKLFHDAKRLLKIIDMNGRALMDKAKSGGWIKPIKKITRSHYLRETYED